MGLCAGLGVLLLQPLESWQGVQALASASHVAGWLLASSWHFGVGLQPCLPHGCLLAGAGSCWRESGRCPAGTGKAVALHARLSWPGDSHHGVYPAKRGFHLPLWACWGHSVPGWMSWQGAPSADDVPTILAGVSWKLLAWESEHMQKHKTD